VQQTLASDQQSGEGPISEPATDGIFDGFNVIQGVRAMNTASGQWTAPDAYAGDISDPMSRKSYMWNRNNPVAFEDPSGYLTIGDVYNFFIGDDVRTLQDSHAGALAKVGAVVSLGSNLGGPEAKGATVVGKTF
jgi:hypothetical protein